MCGGWGAQHGVFGRRWALELCSTMDHTWTTAVDSNVRVATANPPEQPGFHRWSFMATDPSLSPSVRTNKPTSAHSSLHTAEGKPCTTTHPHPSPAKQLPGETSNVHVNLLPRAKRCYFSQKEEEENRTETKRRRKRGGSKREEGKEEEKKKEERKKDKKTPRQKRKKKQVNHPPLNFYDRTPSPPLPKETKKPAAPTTKPSSSQARQAPTTQPTTPQSPHPPHPDQTRPGDLGPKTAFRVSGLPQPAGARPAWASGPGLAWSGGRGGQIGRGM